MRLYGVGRRQREGGMDPAVGVKNILRYILRVYTVDGIADILPSGHDQTERDQDQDGDRVVQTEYRRVDVYVTYSDQSFQTAENIQHLTVRLIVFEFGRSIRRS